MMESTSTAACTGWEWEAAKSAGLLYASPGSSNQETAIHVFAESVRADDMAKNSALRELEIVKEERAAMSMLISEYQNSERKLEAQRDELVAALKRCALVLAGEELNKGSLIRALEAANTVLKKVGAP